MKNNKKPKRIIKKNKGGEMKKLLFILIFLIPSSVYGEDFTPLLKKYFKENWKIAYAIMKAESGGNPRAIGDKNLKYYSYGLFQINRRWHKFSKASLLNPEFNIKIASEIYKKYGFTQWSTYKNGRYKKFMIKEKKSR